LDSRSEASLLDSPLPCPKVRSDTDNGEIHVPGGVSDEDLPRIEDYVETLSLIAETPHKKSCDTISRPTERRARRCTLNGRNWTEALGINAIVDGMHAAR
jgi:hypothetical protein